MRDLCSRYVHVIIIIGLIVLRSSFSAADVNADLDSGFNTAFQAGRYSEALGLSESMLASGQNDALAMVYRGACLAMLDRHEEAIEAFETGSRGAGGKLSDRTCLYLKALAQFRMRAYVRSQKTLDELALRFPNSRLAGQARELALKIEKRLAREITQENLNWYLNRGLDAYNSERPYLVIEYLEEYFLLAKQSGFEDLLEDQRVNMLLGGSYLETFRIDSALVYLERVTPGYEEYRAGVLRAIALKSAGRNEEAFVLLTDVATRTQDTAVKERALRYISDWEK